MAWWLCAPLGLQHVLVARELAVEFVIFRGSALIVHDRASWTVVDVVLTKRTEARANARVEEAGRAWKLWTKGRI